MILLVQFTEPHRSGSEATPLFLQGVDRMLKGCQPSRMRSIQYVWQHSIRLAVTKRPSRSTSDGISLITIPILNGSLHSHSSTTWIGGSRLLATVRGSHLIKTYSLLFAARRYPHDAIRAVSHPTERFSGVSRPVFSPTSMVR